MTSMERPVNLLRATTACNTFYIFLSAARASLLPFFTLFLRLLGLTAFQTGVVMAAKTLTAFVWAPLWARCAATYNKRRTVLVFSLLMMFLTYLSFTAVYYKVGILPSCHVGHGGPQDGNASSVTGGANHSLAGNGMQGGIPDAARPGAAIKEPGGAMLGDVDGGPGAMPGDLDGGPGAMPGDVDGGPGAMPGDVDGGPGAMPGDVDGGPGAMPGDVDGDMEEDETEAATQGATAAAPGLGDAGGDSGGDTRGDSGGDTRGDSGGDTRGDSGGDTRGDTGDDTRGDTSRNTGGDSGGDTVGNADGDAGGDTGGNAHSLEGAGGGEKGEHSSTPTPTPPPTPPPPLPLPTPPRDNMTNSSDGTSTSDNTGNNSSDITADGTSKAGGVQNEQRSDNIDLSQIERLVKKTTGFSLKDIKASGYSTNQLYKLAKQYVPEARLTEAEIQGLLDLEDSQGQAAGGGQPRPIRSAVHIERVARSLNFTFLNTLRDKMGVLATGLEEKRLLLFFVVLLVVIFGEFFSSPVEKIADDAWFDFLERIDDMEKYGRQRYWGSLTFALVPVAVTAAVDYAPCRMIFGVDHFLIHFYVFGVFILLTMLMAFYFPMPPPTKQHKYGSKVAKGLRVVCCDCRGALFAVSLLVAGAVYASFSNFLFWRLQDLGAPELTLGLCVAIGAFAETPMLVFSNRLVKKLGNGGVVTLALVALALRSVYYGFLSSPWAVLPAELTNAFTHTALWYAVLSYEPFNAGSALDRSVRSLLSSLYFGLGFSAGSLLSGLLYQVWGAPVLFWAASAVSTAWGLAFGLFQLCLPERERVKYIKLLRKDDDDDDDSDSEGDDDWLEMALKDQ